MQTLLAWFRSLSFFGGASKMHALDFICRHFGPRAAILGFITIGGLKMKLTKMQVEALARGEIPDNVGVAQALREMAAVWLKVYEMADYVTPVKVVPPNPDLFTLDMFEGR